MCASHDKPSGATALIGLGILVAVCVVGAGFINNNLHDNTPNQQCIAGYQYDIRSNVAHMSLTEEGHVIECEGSL